MHTLWVDKKSTRIDIESKHLLVYADTDQPPRNVPLSAINYVIVSANILISSRCIATLAGEGIMVLVIPSRRGEPAIIAPVGTHGNAERRLQQYYRVIDEDWCLSAAKQLVRFKVYSQYRATRRLDKRYPENRLIFRSAFTGFESLSGKAKLATSIAQLRGLEGAAAKIYFQVYQCCFGASWNFTGRNRRPPKDPVNVMLSLTYTVICSLCEAELIAGGFDPGLGFYHQTSYGRPSLACDLTELFRAMGDRFVLSLVKSEEIRTVHFTQTESGCTMGKAGRSHYYTALAAEIPAWRRLIRKTVVRWINTLPAQPQRQETAHATLSDLL